MDLGSTRAAATTARQILSLSLRISNKAKKTRPSQAGTGLFLGGYDDPFLLDDPEVKRAAFSKQFDPASLAVAPHDLPFALDVFAVQMRQGDRNDVAFRQPGLCFDEQTIPAVIFESAFIKAVFRGEKNIARIRFPRRDSFFRTNFIIDNIHKRFSFPTTRIYGYFAAGRKLLAGTIS
jgi:hypothetical protein